eukprot:128324_1
MALNPLSDNDGDLYECAEVSLQHCSIREDMEEEHILHAPIVEDILNDMDDPSISDEHNKTHAHTNRKKSKSSTNILLQLSPKLPHQSNAKHEEPSLRPRRHSESSSESHSNSKSNPNHVNRDKLPMLIPLNVNRKEPKTSSNKMSLKQSILSKYKSKKHKKNGKSGSSSLGISSPVNVQHVIHVEWDDQRKAYKGIPDVWHSKIPQSVTVPTQTLPVQMQFRDARSSSSVTQSVLQRAKSVSAVHHMPSISHNNTCTPDIAKPKPNTVPIDYMKCNDSLAMPLPGPRVFISSLNAKNRSNPQFSNDISLQIPDFHGLLSSQVMSISEYLSHIGIDDLSRKQSVNMIRREFFVKMGFSKRDPLINIPRHIQQQILTYLDVRSYLRCCVTCSDLASFLDDPIIWKVQVEYKSKVQGTLHKTNFRLRHRIWKATYLSMVKIDQNPRYYDHVWNIVVAGDTKSGQNRLVVSLGRHWRCKLTGLEPVISAVNGTYRFGVDFVIRRVIIRDIIIKLQVWDGGNVMADTALLKAVNIFLILFDLTDRDSFDRTLNIARSMISLLPNDDEHLKLMMVGNTTDNPKRDRVVSYESAKRFANERGLMYIEANTESPQSINEAFVDLAEECILFENEKAMLLRQSAATKNGTNCLIQ